MNERAEKKQRYDHLPMREKVSLQLKDMHDEFSGHWTKEDENPDCVNCLANKKARL